MAILCGLVLLAFGISLAVVWFDALLIVLKGVLVLLLLLGGAFQILIGYAARKAAREYTAGIAKDDGELGKEKR
jgi:hypothetical protein